MDNANPGTTPAAKPAAPKRAQVKRRVAPSDTFFNVDMDTAGHEPTVPSEAFFVAPPDVTNEPRLVKRASSGKLAPPTGIEKPPESTPKPTPTDTELSKERDRETKERALAREREKEKQQQDRERELEFKKQSQVPPFDSTTLSADRIEQLIAQFGAAQDVTVARAMLDTPPPFGARDLAQLMERVISQVAIDMGVSVQEVIAGHIAFGGGATKQFPLTPAQMSLKIKTMSYSNAELGKKLEIAHASIGNLVTRVSELEGERVAALILVNRMKEQMMALEMRAKTAEGAVNVYVSNHEGVNQGGGVPMVYSTTSEGHPIVSVKLNSASASHTNRRKKFTDFSSDDEHYQSEAESQEYSSSDDPTKITRKIINDTANMLSAKKKFDPPSILSVGLKSCLEKEEHLW
ncbi:hypothetical protein HDU98_008400 [Podochytrium sp. JEL0797]|nr:hypothetical protein HDU98_008400 [Podochytrium sp. JEL0797]